MTTTKNNEHKKLNFSSEREQSQACLNSAEHEKNQGRKVLNVPNKQEQNHTCLDSAEREGLRPEGNVPNLRFHEFQGEWKESTIGEMFDLYSGNTPSRLNKEHFKGTVNWISSGELKEHYIYSSKEQISEEAAKSLKLLPVGTYVIAIYGLEAEGVRGTGSIIQEPSTISQACMSFIPKGVIENEFLYSWYKKHGNVIGIRYAQGTKQQNLSYDILEKFRIAYPNTKEQEKLNKFISLLDERIATQSKIIDKLQSLIKGIVDCTILRKEKNAIVGDVCSISEQIRAEANIDDIITVRLHGNGVCKSSAEYLQLGATQYYRRRAGQLIYGKQNFHNGAIGIVPISLDKGITSKDIPSFDIDEMKCNSVYLLAQLQSPQYYKPAEALTTGTGSKRLKEETFLKMPIVLPNKREQDNIAVLIHRASMNLDHAKRLLELLSIQKQFLLRQMFI